VVSCTPCPASIQALNLSIALCSFRVQCLVTPRKLCGGSNGKWRTSQISTLTNLLSRASRLAFQARPFTTRPTSALGNAKEYGKTGRILQFMRPQGFEHRKHGMLLLRRVHHSPALLKRQRSKGRIHGIQYGYLKMRMTILAHGQTGKRHQHMALSKPTTVISTRLQRLP
jgi:hypothetical protein